MNEQNMYRKVYHTPMILDECHPSRGAGFLPRSRTSNWLTLVLRLSPFPVPYACTTRL